MSLVSPTQSNPGDEITAAAINTPVNQLAAVVNGQIDDTNLADAAVTTVKITDASVTNAKLSTTAGEPGGAWKAYTPTLTDITIGNGTIESYYTQIGKTVHVRGVITLGTTSSVATSVGVTLPVEAHSHYGTKNIPVGQVNFNDVSETIEYSGYVVLYDQSPYTAFFQPQNASGTFSYTRNVTSSIPFTWASTDQFIYQFTYEAA